MKTINEIIKPMLDQIDWTDGIKCLVHVTDRECVARTIDELHKENISKEEIFQYLRHDERTTDRIEREHLAWDFCFIFEYRTITYRDE